MAWDATARRRVLGALALVGALAMLLAADTVLKGRLGLGASLLYWLVCLCFTALAMVAALLDLRALRRRSREQQRDLLEQTLKTIATEAKSRHRQRGSNGDAR